jgi:hypothetical protein
VRYQAKRVPFEPVHAAVEAVAQTQRASNDRVEHWLHVGWRAGDDPQDLPGRCLLLERLGQLAIPRPELLEQARVLDRDHRLGGEGLDQRDLALRERSGLGPIEGQRPDRFAFPEQRDAQAGANPLALDRRPSLGELGGEVQLREVRDVDCLAVDDRPAAHRSSTDRSRLAHAQARDD